MIVIRQALQRRLVTLTLKIAKWVHALCQRHIDDHSNDEWKAASSEVEEEAFATSEFLPPDDDGSRIVTSQLSTFPNYASLLDYIRTIKQTVEDTNDCISSGQLTAEDFYLGHCHPVQQKRMMIFGIVFGFQTVYEACSKVFNLLFSIKQVDTYQPRQKIRDFQARARKSRNAIAHQFGQPDAGEAIKVGDSRSFGFHNDEHWRTPYDARATWRLIEAEYAVLLPVFEKLLHTLEQHAGMLVEWRQSAEDWRAEKDAEEVASWALDKENPPDWDLRPLTMEHEWGPAIATEELDWT